MAIVKVASHHRAGDRAEMPLDVLIHAAKRLRYLIQKIWFVSIWGSNALELSGDDIRARILLAKTTSLVDGVECRAALKQGLSSWC